MEHRTIVCTACSGSILRYASALPASAENAKPAMLDTSAASRTTAAVALAIHASWRCWAIALAMFPKSTSAHTASAVSADHLKSGPSSQAPISASPARSVAATRDER